MNLDIFFAGKSKLFSVIKSRLFLERVFILLLVTSLVTIWFHRGLILGSGESGLPFYNTQKLLDTTAHTWSDTPLGGTSTVGYASYPFYIAISFFQGLGIPSFLLQAAVYWLVFFIGTISIHKLSTMVPGTTSLSRISASLFYIFNPVVHVAVLHRFQYPMILFYGFIPFAFLLYFIGLRRKKFFSLVVLNLSTVLFSFIFVGPAFFELLFLVLALVSFYYFLLSLQKRRLEIFPLVYFAVFVVIFVLVNAWWLSPIVSTFFLEGETSAGLKFFSPEGNVSTFKSISQELKSVLSVFRLFPVEFYKGNGASWGWLYYTPLFVLLGFFFIFAFIASLFRKGKSALLKFLILLSVTAMFFMKGALPPFGEISLFLIRYFTVFQVFRNPFEKIGLLLPFAMAIPVGIGTTMIIGYLYKRIRINVTLTSIVVLILTFPIYMFPIVNGYVFTGGASPADDIRIGQYVKVPKYYEKAREWLNRQGEEPFRVLVFPLDGEGMTYRWEYGYAGVELSNNLFDQSFISYSTGQTFLPETVDAINEALFRNPESLWLLAQMLNVRYLMIRDDIDHVARDTYSPDEAMYIVKNKLKDHFSLVSTFGKLSFFEINSNNFNSRIYTHTNPLYLYSPHERNFDLIPFGKVSSKDLLLFSNESSLEDLQLGSLRNVTLGGRPIYNLRFDPDREEFEDLPFVRFNRNSRFYQLLRLKEDIQTKFLSSREQIFFRFNLLGKRLAEARQFSKERELALEEYKQRFLLLSKDLLEIIPRETAFSLLHQQRILENLQKEDLSIAPKAKEIIEIIDQFLIEAGFRSIFPTDKPVIFRFHVARAGEYEILLSKDSWERYYQNLNEVNFDLDGNNYQMRLDEKKKNDRAFSFGSFFLERGVHEISTSNPYAFNLIFQPELEEIILSSQKKHVYKKNFPILNFDIYSKFLVSFEYFVEKGNAPMVAIEQDSDTVDEKGQNEPRVVKFLTRDDYDFGWKKYAFDFSPYPTTKQMQLFFEIVPWGDCKSVVKRSYKKYCKNEDFNQRFLRDSVVRVRNLKVERVFTNPIILREINKPQIQTFPPKAEFTQVSPARYKVSIAKANRPFFLALSTSFDPRWRTYFIESRPKSLFETITDSLPGTFIPQSRHFLANGYSNAWYVDKTGDFDLFIEYSPERIYILGQKISLLFVGILLTIVFFKPIYDRYRTNIS